MTLKIIYNYNGDDAVVEKPKLNMEITLQKTFAICNKIIDTCGYVMDHLDIKDLYENYTEAEMFNEEITDKDRLMRIFSLICGQKVNVLQAIAYATIILRRIKDMAESGGMEIVPDKEEKYKVEYMSDDEALAIGEMIRNLGIDYVHDFVAQTRAEAGIFDNEARCRDYYKDKITDVKLHKMYVPELAATSGTFTPNGTVDIEELAKKFENKIGNPKDSRADQKHPDVIVEHRPKVGDKEEQTVYSQYKKAYEQIKESSERYEPQQNAECKELIEKRLDEFNIVTSKLDKEKQEATKKLPKSLVRWSRRRETGRHKFDSS